MILNVKKSNFYIYLFSLLTGFVLISISVILMVFNYSNIAANILLSIGCSTIPSIIVAYLIDRANEKRNAIKINSLRDSFLWGMPYGLLWIMKIIIEEYYPLNEASNMSFFDCFKQAISILRSKTPSDKGIFEYEEERKSLMKKLEYGINICLRDCKLIIEHGFEAEINSILSKDELLSIKYLYDECEKIQNSYIISETAEYIDLFVKTIYDGIPEFKMRSDRAIILKKKYIKNWYEISK